MDLTTVKVTDVKTYTVCGQIPFPKFYYFTVLKVDSVLFVIHFWKMKILINWSWVALSHRIKLLDFSINCTINFSINCRIVIQFY